MNHPGGTSAKAFSPFNKYGERFTMTPADPILLSDEQIRQYIANGYVQIETDVPAHIHTTIGRKLDEMVAEGPNLGNNVLPRVPEFRHILNSPQVRGALSSLLGPDYVEHPHRYCHDSRPLEETPDDIPARVAQQSHQDSYTPMSRPRQHYSRYARIIYYPRDTPIELGPTHVTPGTSYHKVVTEEDRYAVQPMVGPAGSLWITHFDVIHAAGVNLTDQVRHMIKFIYLQRSVPAAPSWDCRDQQWRNPADLQCPWDLEIAWSHMWDWMCGKQNRYDSFFNGAAAEGNLAHLIDVLEKSSLEDQLAAVRQLAALGGAAAAAVPTLANLLNKDPQPLRVAATYALGAIGAPAVETLVEQLDEAAQEGWEKRGQAGWNEGSVEMLDEAHALGAIGTPAVAPLLELLERTAEWGRINAAFALGEMDARASAAVAALTQLLDEDSHRVVRTALDALGTIGNAEAAVPRMARFLGESRAEWEEVLTGTRAWTARDQVRINSATALARLGPRAQPAEEALIGALDDPAGYVSLYATEALRQLQTPSAERALMDMIWAQRWDASLSAERPW